MGGRASAMIIGSILIVLAGGNLLEPTLIAQRADARVAEAAKRGDVEAVRTLIKQKVPVTTAQPDGSTALHWAAHHDNMVMAELLIQAGAAVNAANDLGVTSLSLACTNGSIAMTQKLLQRGANPNSVQSTGESALMTAARTGAINVVQALLARGADVNHKESARGQNALMWAVAQQHHAVARLLIDHKADVSAGSATGFTPLLFAARNGDLAGVKMLLDAGAGVNEAALDGSTALLVATVRGQLALALFLLDRGADPNASGAGYTPLHWASGRWETGLTGPAGIPPQPSGEWSSLIGLQNGQQDFIKALIAHGANPNARVSKTPPRFGFSLSDLSLIGATPFFLASVAADVTVMRLLLEHGADPLQATDEGHTPLMAAAGFGRVIGETRVTEAASLEATKLALELGGDVNASTANGETALFGAVFTSADSVVQLLLERGAKVNPRNKRGQTPLSFADGIFYHGAYRSSKSIAEMLRKAGGTT